MFWYRHQWNPASRDWHRLKSPQTSLLVVHQLSYQEVSSCIFSRELDSKSEIESFLTITSAFGRVRHSHIRLTVSCPFAHHRLLMIHGKVVSEVFQSETALLMRKLQDDLLLFSKCHPATLHVSLKVCVVSLVLKPSQWSETLPVVLPVGASGCFHPSGSRGVNHRVNHGIVRSELSFKGLS